MATLAKNPKDKDLSQHISSGTGVNFSKKTSRKVLDPAGLWKGSPKKPEKTAEQLAIERRNRSLLDKEIAEEETRLKAGARGQRGMKSLLGKAASNRKNAATKSGTTSTNSNTPSRASGSMTQGAYSRQ